MYKNIKNRKYKFLSDDYHRENSPWNIAADFLVDMSFSTKLTFNFHQQTETGMKEVLFGDKVLVEAVV